MSWLSDFVQKHEELEAPQSFYYWAGIAALSAVVKDNIWLPRFVYNLYPNVYVMLHADSGMKKGPPVSAARQLVKAVNNTHIIGGRSSIQGILKEMGRGASTPGGKIAQKSTAFICSSELTSSIVEDKVATKILTDLYDRQYNIGEWASLLKMETFQLNNPTVSMLTATNEAMSEDFFTRSAIQGGYFARTFMIVETVRNRANSLLVPLKYEIDYKKSAEYLREIAKLEGPFELLGSRTQEEPWIHPRMNSVTNELEYFTEAGKIYEDWYTQFIDLMDNMETKDATGTLNRFGDSVLKVAMLLSLAEQPKKVITPEAMSLAISQCEKLLGNVRKATLGREGLSESAGLKSTIIFILLHRDNHMITRELLMKKLWSHYSNQEEVDGLMQSFDAAGMIKTENLGNTIVYRMPQQQVLEYSHLLNGKMR